ncbi:hypothetical protein L9F63_001611, partial [Diploptera punctata]
MDVHGVFQPFVKVLMFLGMYQHSFNSTKTVYAIVFTTSVIFIQFFYIFFSISDFAFHSESILIVYLCYVQTTTNIIQYIATITTRQKFSLFLVSILKILSQINLMEKYQYSKIRNMVMFQIGLHTFCLSFLYTTDILIFSNNFISSIFLISTFVLELINSVRECVFVSFLKVLQEHYWRLNEIVDRDICKTTEHILRHVTLECPVEVKRVAYLHQVLCLITKNVASFFSVQMLLSSAHDFIFIITNVYFIISVYVFDKETNEGKNIWRITLIFWSSYYLLKFLWLIHSCRVSTIQV